MEKGNHARNDDHAFGIDCVGTGRGWFRSRTKRSDELLRHQHWNSATVLISADWTAPTPIVSGWPKVREPAVALGGHTFRHKALAP